MSGKINTMSKSAREKIFVGPFIHSNEQGELIIVDRGMIHVKNGKVCIGLFLFIFNLQCHYLS